MANVALQGGRMKKYKEEVRISKKKSDKLWESFILTELARDQYEVGSKEYLLLHEICKKFCDMYLDQIIKELEK